MGWLKLKHRSPAHTADSEQWKAKTQHVESVSGAAIAEGPNPFPPISLDAPDDNLPYITPDEVRKRRSAETGGLLIVVDDVVFDCAQFLEEHPGGRKVIESFAGEECSWQFWRFHAKKDMEEFGRTLRIGKTKGIENKFKEPERYVGLRKFANDDWHP